MRIRTRNVITRSITTPYETYTLVKNHCNGAVDTIPGYWNGPRYFALDGFNEYMADGLGKGMPHTVKHRKYTYVTNDTGNVWYYTSGGTVDVHASRYSNVLDATNHKASLDWDVSNFAQTPQGWNITLPVNEASLIENCYEAAKGLKADILLNTVEANQIWPSIKSLAMSLPLMAQHWEGGAFTRTATKRGRLALKNYIKTASGAFLAWKFGVSPILSDIQNTVRYLPKIGQDVKRHADGDKSRFSARGNCQVGFVPNNVTDFYGSNIVKMVRPQGRVELTPEVRYVLVTKPSTKYHTDFFRNLDNAMQRFASSPASLAWERIPFSFVVDWFVDLRGALRKLDDIVGHSPFEIVSFTRSLRYGLATDIYGSRNSPCSGAPLQAKTYMSASYKHYERSIVPLGATAPTWRPRFGKNQAGITAALISQQLTKIR
jgi:hypothetical protein